MKKIEALKHESYIIFFICFNRMVMEKNILILECDMNYYV